MKNTYFKKQAAFKVVYANMKAAHPDWDSKKLYAVTKATVDK